MVRMVLNGRLNNYQYLPESYVLASKCSISSKFKSTLTHECFSILFKSSNSVATSFIVGLSSPFNLKQFSARFATSFNCSVQPSFAICYLRNLNNLFFFQEMRKYVTKLLSTSGLSNESSYLHVNTSTRTTPKL